ncbi:phosphodiester glycosidase family protein [Thermocoleostomius sinensis]|uniref:Phosphodiester glycosidase family protein n=1 Tax=Thermocoleostomius sinensis A174 TaxID=2016057 RepID=A0A9E8Z9K9_9CYAN|nr:phosphodiester glycosidase family protein [Thermocoleostomius sinensis]WAL58836.1 phosphodiester glycosidase family protein [Thermocoleostomius sinensis A174]
MVKSRRRSLWLFGLALWLCYACSIRTPPTQQLTPAVVPLQAVSSKAESVTFSTGLAYRQYTIEQSLVHVLQVAADAPLILYPAVADTTASLAEFVESTGAIAAVNGGFFDPVNQQTTSYVVLQGEVVADPRLNERLVGNPDLTPYLDRIFRRSEFRQYQCGQAVQYDIAPHDAVIPSSCQLVSALGGGPQLLPTLRLVEEAFADYADGELVRDALGSAQPNARTAVGITSTGDVVLVMAAQTPDTPIGSGLSLPALAEFMATLGAVKALNLDGGSSSSLFYAGQIHYGKVAESGTRIERPVKSALLVLEE